MKTSAYVLLAALALATPMAGCTVTVEPAVLYEGSEESATVPYTSGLNISVSGDNGSIDVVRGSGSDVRVTWQPFITDADDNEENARAHMENNLTFTAVENGGTITISADKKDGSSSSLGADIVVTLPAGFDGSFTLNQGNGSTDVDLSGSTPSSMNIYTDNGSLDVILGSFAGGKIENDGAGDVELTMPSASDGVLTMTTDGVGTIIESGFPSAEVWACDGDDQVKTCTMNTGMGPTLDVIGGFDIIVNAN